jgi:hypothetical protein
MYNVHVIEQATQDAHEMRDRDRLAVAVTASEEQRESVNHELFVTRYSTDVHVQTYDTTSRNPQRSRAPCKELTPNSPAVQNLSPLFRFITAQFQREAAVRVREPSLD